MIENQDRKLNIVLLAQTLQLRSEGVYTLNLAEGLSLAGHHVKVVTGGGDLEEAFNKSQIPLLIFKPMATPSKDLFRVTHLVNEIKSLRPDLLHLQSSSLSSLGRALVNRLKKPYFITITTTFNLHRISLARRWIRGIIVMNESAREHLVNEIRLPKDLLQIIPPGVNIKRIREVTPDELPRNRRPVIGVTGPLVPWQGHQYFLSAAREILDSGLRAQFLITGEGPLEPTLRKQMHELKLQDSVIFMPDPTKYYQVLPTIDLFVFPLLQMGTGLSILEAMASGKPVITTSVGDMYQFIKENETGFIVPPASTQAIKEKVTEVLNNKILALEVGLRARRFVEENFSLEKMINQTMTLYFKEINIP